MSLVALGLDHHTAPQDLRGRFSVSADRLVPALQSLRSRLARTAEVAIVSTCNRTELWIATEASAGPVTASAGAFSAAGALPTTPTPAATAAVAATDDAAEIAHQALGWLAESGNVAPQALWPHLCQRQDAAAARHAFRLASGLASMVVGETQILGQMKLAVREAESAGTLGTTLHQLFQRSFAVAKEVRTGTEIGMHTISLAAAIVRLATDLFEDFGELKVLFIGAGDMAAPVLAHLAGKGPKVLAIANRSVGRAESLAARFGADAIGLTTAMARLAEFDVVVSCTASPVPLIGLGAVERALKSRRRRPVLMVDLAVPRDIEPEVADLPDVYLYSIDDLGSIVASGSARRHAAVDQAEAIIETGVQDFARWLDTRRTVPLIQALQSQAETWRAAELMRARKLLAKGENIDAVLEAMSRGLTQKMLHGPMAGLQATEGEERQVLTGALSKLFLSCPMRARSSV